MINKVKSGMALPTQKRKTKKGPARSLYDTSTQRIGYFINYLSRY